MDKFSLFPCFRKGLIGKACYFLAILCMNAFWVSGPAYSVDILKTGDFTYHSSDGRLTVVVVPGLNGISGLFISASADPLKIQQFTLDDLSYGKTSSIALLLGARGFEKVVVGSKELKRRGTFTARLTVGGNKTVARVTVDENNPSYCSIVVEGSPPSILGFMGTTEIFNLSDPDAVKLLSPASLTDRFQGVIGDYVVDASHKMKVGNEMVKVNYVGLPHKSKNVCQLKDTLVIDEEGMKSLKKSEKKPWGVKTLKKYDKAKSLFDTLVPLRVTKRSMIGLDMQSGEIKHIREVDSKNKNVDLCYSTTARID